ncbi:mycofactocin-coupled SDR family oxidoreductase [Spirillospora sp. CA-255316]
MGRVEGQVALISGIARGQGRSHAVRLAEEGADIIGFDICAQIDSVEYPMASREDLRETVSLVEATGRKIYAEVADVRDRDAVQRVVDEGVARFGRLDIVLANAGIMAITGGQRHTDQAFLDGIEVMLTGVYNTVRAAIPHVQAGGRGGAIVITSSTAGLRTGPSDGNPGLAGYVASKHGVVGLMRLWANAYAAENIRFNTVHPCGVATPMVTNEAFANYVQEVPEMAENLQNPLPVPGGLIEAEDVTNQILHLVSGTGRYITGSTVVVDAGFTAR